MTKTEEIMELAKEYAFRSSELVGEYPPNGDECEWAKQAESDLKSAIEELVSKSDMDDAMLAGNAALIADMKSKLNECHAALSFLLDRKPQFGAFDYGFGSASLGNLRAELGIYKVKETP